MGTVLAILAAVAFGVFIFTKFKKSRNKSDETGSGGSDDDKKQSLK